MICVPARRDGEIDHLQTPAGLAPVGAGVLADAAVHSLPILGPLLSLVRACGLLPAPSPIPQCPSAALTLTHARSAAKQQPTQPGTLSGHR